MPEEQGRTGDVANNRLITLLEGLGWELGGEPNIDIPCTIGKHHDRSNDHGVDGYLTYEDPFRDLERGVFIESKSRQWESVNSSNLDQFMRQLIDAMECAPEADEFQSRLNFGTPRNYNAGILGVWVNDDNYDHADFAEYIDDVKIRKLKKRPLQISLLGNSELNRLASLLNEFNSLQNQFSGENQDVNFFYPSVPGSEFPDTTKVASLEYILSDFVSIEINTFEEDSPRNRNPKDIHAVFYFGDVNLSALDFLFKYLIQYQMLGVDEIWIYLDYRYSEVEFTTTEAVRSQFLSEVVTDDEDIDEDIPEFKFKRLPEVNYASYMDRLRGE